MSGHSKWANIKHKKASIDAKRGKIFSKLVKETTVAVKNGGSDPATNLRLKLVLSQAKEANVPSKNIDNAIKRGTGEIKGGDIIEATYEGYGPKGVAIIVDCVTDNTNRTFSDIRTVFSKNGGNLGESGSVAWQFKKKGIIFIEKAKIENEENFIEQILDFGVEDSLTEEEMYIVYTTIKDFSSILSRFKENSIEILDSEINYVPKNEVELSQEDCDSVQNLINKIEEMDDVQLVASNEKVVN